jgi:hypothetical protein
MNRGLSTERERGVPIGYGNAPDQASETYHHWRIFANGASGVCISFRRRELLSAVEGVSGLEAKPVKYLKLAEIRDRDVAVRDLRRRRRRSGDRSA